jgi:uncharacterized phage protein (TIGR01671 family)
MNREIEFRGKRFDNGKWAYGNLIIDDSGNSEIIDYENNREIRYDVMGETICQFTGKYDKNQRKVYEDDIILQQGYNGRKKKMVVRFENGAFIVGYHSGSSTRKRPMLISDKCEVIGNIHDNPELLQED